MRKHHSPIAFPSNDISCEETPYDGCTWTYSKEGSSDYNKAPRVLSGDTNFDNCEWSSCSATYGGAISVENKNIELIIEQCFFKDCTAEKDCGGAIYINHINKFKITESSFYHCTVLSNANHYNSGGGIHLYNVAQDALIQSTSFLDSTIPDDGAGVNMWYCSCRTGNTKTFQDCRFVNCKAESRVDSEGGGFLAWANTYNVGVSNSLFCKCSSLRSGGLELSLTEPFTTLITFAFFSDNKAEYGNDIAVGPILPTNEDFLLHSFATTPSDVIGFYDGTWKTAEIDWLPQGRQFFFGYVANNLSTNSIFIQRTRRYVLMIIIPYRNRSSIDFFIPPSLLKLLFLSLLPILPSRNA